LCKKNLLSCDILVGGGYRLEGYEKEEMEFVSLNIPIGMQQQV
jgi:hypothetical protein